MKYKEIQDGEWVQPAQSNHRLACCDCGLVHLVHYRIVKGKVQFQAWRDKRATAYRRKKLNNGK